MKKVMLFGVVLLMCVSLLVGTAWAGLDLSAEYKYDMDTITTEGSTKVVTGLDLGPLDFTLTWERDWIPSISDSLKVKAATTVWIIDFEYEKELLELDSGVFTATLPITPLTFEYVRDFDDDVSGTIMVKFSKSF